MNNSPKKSISIIFKGLVGLLDQPMDMQESEFGPKNHYVYIF